MIIIRNLSFTIPSLTLAAGLALPAPRAHAADAPGDGQAQAQRVVIAATAPRRGPVADGTRVLDLQLQANRVMVTASTVSATHRAATAAVHLDAQESARRLLEGRRAGV
jgi:hypothetical protein